MREEDIVPGTAVVKGDEHEVDIELLLARLPAGPRRGVVHVGAHVGEEVPAYFHHGFQWATLVDANPDACREMERRFASDARVTVIEAAAVAEPGPLRFNLHTSRSGSVEAASVLPMKELNRIVKAMHTPRVLDVRGETLDALLAERGVDPAHCDLLNLDVQGAELLVLQGASRALSSCRWVVTEINCLELYEGGTREADLEHFLQERGFARDFTIYHRYYDENGWFIAWGEALFARRPDAA